jgi:SAM-dependent methyltransferase
MSINCRFCQEPLTESFVNLGVSPLANSYLTAEKLTEMEPHYELHPRVCSNCFLVQLPAFETPENIFGDYAYFSSYSDSWLAHCKAYAESISKRLDLNSKSLVLELASNDGYLLQYFKDLGIPVLGVEPAGNVAEVAKEKGIPTITRFFGKEAGREIAEKGQADLVIANNVLAHVPDINDFVAGITAVLKPGGVATLEFPSLLELMRKNLFDTIYHEHFSYLSLYAVESIFGKQGLSIFDVDRLTTHGGSLRIYAGHKDCGHETTDSIINLRKEEEGFGINRITTYKDYAAGVARLKRQTLRFLIEARDKDKKVAAYGAPAKSTTLFSYCGIGPDLIAYTVDRSPHKQNRYLPGSRIFIDHPDRLRKNPPDYIVILPWNIRDEIIDSLNDLRSSGTKFVTFIPQLEII